MLGSRFYRQIRTDRKISFILVYNSACFRVFWMGQISVKVGGLLVFLLFAFCGSVKAVGDGLEDQTQLIFILVVYATLNEELPSFRASVTHLA